MRGLAERKPAEPEKGRNQKRRAALAGVPGRDEHAERRQRTG